MGISLWLVPNEENVAKIKTVMQHRPAVAPNSSSSFPAFHPHVTLATTHGADAAARLRTALPAAGSRPVVPVRFKSADAGDKYFMSVYVVVHAPAGSPLADLRSHLRAALGPGEGTVPPVPHVSLYYIDDADADERRRTLRELLASARVVGVLGAEGDSVMDGDGDETVALGCYASGERREDGSPHLNLMRGFDGEEVWLVRCDGPVEGWEVLEKFPLEREP